MLFLSESRIIADDTDYADFKGFLIYRVFSPVGFICLVFLRSVYRNRVISRLFSPVSRMFVISDRDSAFVDQVFC